jgi:hypothetical protein
VLGCAGQGLAQGQPGSILALPSDFRAQPLAALGGRIMALPPQDRGAAIDDFLAHNVPVATPRLTDLKTAAGQGWMALAQREFRLIRPGGVAHAAMVGGSNVQTVARNLDISGQDAIANLEGIAMLDAKDAVQRGEPALVAARRMGIALAKNLQALRDHAMHHHALPAVN